MKKDTLNAVGAGVALLALLVIGWALLGLYGIAVGSNDDCTRSVRAMWEAVK